MVEQFTQFLMQILKPVVDLISQHPLAVIVGGLGWWIFSGVTSSLPTPTAGDGRGYAFAYNLAHWMSGSIGRIYEWLRFGRSAAPPSGDKQP